jgi:hypothetical protein
MQIEKLEIDNFLRLGRVRIDFSEAVMHLFAGHNEAGKTSLQEAIRFCLLGETARVKLKRDYKMMVKDGATSGEVRLVLDNGDVLVRDVATGRGSAEEFGNVPAALEYLLDATRYAWLTEKQRRAFMFNLMHIKVKADDVKARLMEDRGVDEAMADVIMPMLKAGFDAAHSFCKDKATEGRGAWKQITGETYGAKKALEWTLDPTGGVDVADHTAAKAALVDAKKAYEAAAKKYGADSERKRLVQGQTFPCPSCGVTICLDNQHPKPVRVVTDEDRAVTLKDQHELDDGAQQVLDKAAADLDAAEAAVEAISVAKERVKNAESIEKEALATHKQIEKWVAAADALAPTGIPAELIAEKIEPLNNRLRETAVMTGWPQTSVTPDMQILVDNRPYALQSESSQWRAQAAIAEAISLLSDVGILVLDRIDVLDLKNRAALLKWLLKVAGEHRNIFLFGTLKEPPKVPATIKVHWLEKGKIQEAA